jgi:hypothetical protein
VNDQKYFSSFLGKPAPAPAPEIKWLPWVIHIAAVTHGFKSGHLLGTCSLVVESADANTRQAVAEPLLVPVGLDTDGCRSGSSVQSGRCSVHE